MAEELEIKINVTGAREANRQLGSVRKGIKNVASGLNGLSKKAAIATTALAGLAVVGAIKATRAFVEFEDQMANVRKTTGATVDELKVLGDGILELSKSTRTSIIELTEIATIGGLIGIATEDILEFVEATDQAVVALGDEFTGGAEEVTRALGTLGQSFGVFEKEGVGEGIRKIGSAINGLGAAGLATGPFLTNFTQRLGGIRKQSKLSVEDMLAVGATFQELGFRVEFVAGATTKAFLQMQKETLGFAQVAGVSLEEFKEVMERDGLEALKLFLTGLNKVDNQAVVLDDLKLGGIRVSAALQGLAGNMDLLNEKQALSTKLFKEGVSLSDEFNIKNETAAANIAKFQNTLDRMLITLGAEFVPILTKVLEKMTPWIEKLMPKIVNFIRDEFVPEAKRLANQLIELLRPVIQWIKENPELVKQIGLVTAGLLALNTALRIGAFLFGDVARIALGLGQIILPGVTATLNALFPAIGAVNVALGTMIGIGVVGVALLWTKVLSDLSAQFDELDEQIRRFNEAAGVRAEVKEKGFQKVAELQQAGTVPKTVSTLAEVRAFERGGIAEAEKVRLKNAIRNAFSLAKKGLISEERKQAIIRTAKEQLGFQGGGILGGGSSNGDRLLFRGNAGEMVLNKSQQARLFKVLSEPRSVTVNANNNSFGGERAPLQEMNMFSNLLIGAV